MARRSAIVAVAFAFAGACACELGVPAASSASTVGAPASRAGMLTALERVFRARRADATWFAPSLLLDSPLEHFQDTLDVLHLTLGDFEAVLGSGQDYVVRFSGGERSVHAKLDEQGRFVVLLIGAS